VNRGHEVFFDRHSLEAASDYNDRIRAKIRSSDRFLFLASRAAIQPGKYTLTEIDLARQAWPSPVGRVISVIVDPDLAPEMLPAYLSSVAPAVVSGSAPAEIVAMFERAGKIKLACWSCLAISAGLLIGLAALLRGIANPTPFSDSDVSIVRPDYVHFRPRERPPSDFGKAGSDAFWISSPVTITLPIAYSSRNTRSPSVQIIEEDLDLEIGDRKENYRWAYIVEIGGASLSDGRCSDWLCQRSSVKSQNLRPGEIAETRETMYLPVSNTPVKWKELIDAVLIDAARMKVTMRAKLVVADGGTSELRRELACELDTAGARALMLQLGYKPNQNPRPPTWQPRCRDVR
jgi:hypothetical protein